MIGVCRGVVGPVCTWDGEEGWREGCRRKGERRMGLMAMGGWRGTSCVYVVRVPERVPVSPVWKDLAYKYR